MLTSEERRRRNNDSNRRRRQSERRRARDDRLEAGACILAPKERCVAFYRTFTGGSPIPHYSRDAQQKAVRRLVGLAGRG